MCHLVPGHAAEMYQFLRADNRKPIFQVPKPGLFALALAFGLLIAATNSTAALAASRGLCTAINDKKWTVPRGCAAARVTITHDNAILDAAPPTNPKAGAFMALTVVQDAKGHPVVWGKHVAVDPTTSTRKELLHLLNA